MECNSTKTAKGLLTSLVTKTAKGLLMRLATALSRQKGMVERKQLAGVPCQRPRQSEQGLCSQLRLLKFLATEADSEMDWQMLGEKMRLLAVARG